MQESCPDCNSSDYNVIGENRRVPTSNAGTLIFETRECTQCGNIYRVQYND